MKSKTVPSFGNNAFFIRTCFLVSSINFGVPSIRKENDLLFAILSIIFLSCRPTGSLLRMSSVNTATLAIFLRRRPKVDIWRDIFSLLLLLAIVKVRGFQSGYTSLQVL